MTLRVSGKNLDIGESLRTHVEARLDFIVAKYAAALTNGHVTIEREGSGFRTDCILHLCSGAILQVDADAQDAYGSFNLAVDRIEKRLIRHKGKLKDRAGANAHSVDPAASTGKSLRSGDANDYSTADMDDADDLSIEDLGPIVIAESFEGLKEMSVSTAVRELDVTQSHVVIFRHAGDGRPNIVYRRTDGNIGWIDPTHSPKA